MSINIATGIKTLELTGEGTVSVRFNPTDMNFVEQLYQAFSAMEKRNDERKEKMMTLDNEEYFDLAREINREMRQIINGLFGDGVCETLFGDMNMYALADGAPLWENLMFAIIEQCDTAIAEERLKENPRIKKYLQKYKNK